MIQLSTQAEINQRIADAQRAYGPFASTHEALGVALEEWDEFRHAVQSNDIKAIRHEALDLAAVLIRLHDACVSDEGLRKRSVKHGVG